MLPAETLMLLSKYLSGMDIARLSCVCKYFHEVFGYNKLWVNMLKSDILQMDSTMMKTAMKETKDWNLKTYGLERVFYIFHKKVERNWRNGRYKWYLTPCQHMSRDEDHMVTLNDSGGYFDWVMYPFAAIAYLFGWNVWGREKPTNKYVINVFDLCQSDLAKQIHKNVILARVKQFMFGLPVEQIYNYKDKLVIVYGEEYTSRHRLVVLDMNKNSEKNTN